MARQYLLYSITLQGTASGNGFRRGGILALTQTVTTVTNNGINPLEVMIKSGRPASSPETGAIQYATNSGLLGGGAQLDMAYVKYDSKASLIRINPASNIAAVAINCFNASSGLAAFVYAPALGEIQIQLQSSGQYVRGLINILGRSPGLYGNSTYIASLTGSFIGSRNNLAGI